MLNARQKGPLYNHANMSRRAYCAKHKHTGMVDVKSAECKAEECDSLPSFNHANIGRGVYCAKHKNTGMVEVVRGGTDRGADIVRVG